MTKAKSLTIMNLNEAKSEGNLFIAFYAFSEAQRMIINMSCLVATVLLKLFRCLNVYKNNHNIGVFCYWRQMF